MVELEHLKTFRVVLKLVEYIVVLHRTIHYWTIAVVTESNLN